MKMKSALGLLAAVMLYPVSALAQHGGQAPATVPASSAMRVKDLIPLLQKGGHILLLRHERTAVQSPDDDFSKPATDCFSQRNLSVAGVASARQTGEALAALKIPIENVLATPMCRGMETARHMFGRATPHAALMHHDITGKRTLDIAAAEFSHLVEQTHPATGNIVMVTHGGHLSKAFGARMIEGSFVVLAKQGAGKWAVIGTFHGSELDPWARDALLMK